MHPLNVYLSDLAVLNVKLHNLHWNVVGPQFVQLHEFVGHSQGLFGQHHLK
jgi:DNA-binding ferritin-like protein